MSDNQAATREELDPAVQKALEGIQDGGQPSQAGTEEDLVMLGGTGDATGAAVIHTNKGDMGIDDFMRLRGNRASKDVVDVGTIARSRLNIRSQKIKRAAARTYMVILTLVVAVVAGLGYYVYHQTFEVPGKRMVDFRPCKYVDDKLGLEITGQREFSYLERSLFGVNYRLQKDITEKTQIDIQGDAITVVGLNATGEKKWWAKYADLGERGIMLLDPADQYVFTTKKRAAVVDYAQFCR